MALGVPEEKPLGFPIIGADGNAIDESQLSAEDRAALAAFDLACAEGAKNTAPAFKPGDSVRIKAFAPTINADDNSPLDAESGRKTDYIPRFSHNESILLGCSLEIENALTFGVEGLPAKGEPFWTYALEHAIQAHFSRVGLRNALAERIPLGTTLVIFACGASVTIATDKRSDAPLRCPDERCDRCHPKEPRWAVVVNMLVDGKMVIESLATR